MQTIATQKQAVHLLPTFKTSSTSPQRAFGTIILDESQRKDLDVICLGAELCHSSQFDDNHGIEIENATSLLSQKKRPREADRSEWALLNGAVTLSLAAMVNTLRPLIPRCSSSLVKSSRVREDRFLQVKSRWINSLRSKMEKVIGHLDQRRQNDPP